MTTRFLLQLFSFLEHFLKTERKDPSDWECTREMYVDGRRHRIPAPLGCTSLCFERRAIVGNFGRPLEQRATRRRRPLVYLVVAARKNLLLALCAGRWLCALQMEGPANFFIAFPGQATRERDEGMHSQVRDDVTRKVDRLFQSGWVLIRARARVLSFRFVSGNWNCCWRSRIRMEPLLFPLIWHLGALPARSRKCECNFVTRCCELICRWHEFSWKMTVSTEICQLLSVYRMQWLHIDMEEDNLIVSSKNVLYSSCNYS